jgi:hypothetical protein
MTALTDEIKNRLAKAPFPGVMRGVWLRRKFTRAGLLAA